MELRKGEEKIPFYQGFEKGRQAGRVNNEVVSKSAAKELSKLQSAIITRIVKAVRDLSDDPKPKGSKKLRGSSDNWRIRIGD